MQIRCALKCSVVFFCGLLLGCFEPWTFAKGFAHIPTLQGGYYTVSGDFNGDGKTDLAGSNFCQGKPCAIEVAFGNGDGTFQSPIATAVSGVQPFLAVGDVNGDHKVDIIMFSSVDWGMPNNSITALLGDGHGHFGAPIVTMTDDMDMSSFEVGDINGDGLLDVIEVPAAGNLWNTFSVFLGNGDGTFRAPVSSAAGNNSRCTRVGDFNRDGKLDVVTWGQSSDALHLGNGDGTFKPPISIALQPYGCPAVADLNGDGVLDIASGTNAGDAEVIYGIGDGTFGKAFSYKISHPAPGSAQISIADISGDGKPDLLVDDRLHHILYVLWNKGRSKFAPAVGYLEPTGEAIFPVRDINSDGKDDVVLGGQYLGLSQRGGTLALPRSYLVFGRPALDAATDSSHGKTNLVVMSQSSASRFPTGFISLLRGDGKGAFSTAKGFSTRNSHLAATMVVGDLNGDGYPDVLVADRFAGDSGYLTEFLARTTSFGPAVNSSLGFLDPISVAVADFNGDGKLDAAVANSFSLYPSVILLGNGDGTFTQTATLPDGITSLVAADFNHDGKPDLLVASPEGVGVMLGNGDGTFKPVSNLESGQTGSLLVGDFNGDGLLDAVGFGNPDLKTGIVSVYPGNGDGTLRPAINTISDFTAPFRTAVGDFDGDGKLDVVVPASVSNPSEFYILPGKGDGTFGQPLVYQAGRNPVTFVAGDFNGDGAMDLAIVDTGEEAVVTYLNAP